MFKRASLARTSDSHQQANSSQYYAAAWGSPVATPIPQQPQSPSEYQSDLSSPIERLYRSPRLSLVEAASTEPDIFQLGEILERSEKTNWLSDSEGESSFSGRTEDQKKEAEQFGKAFEEEEDSARTPTRAIFANTVRQLARRREDTNTSHQTTHRGHASTKTITPKDFSIKDVTMFGFDSLGSMNDRYPTLKTTPEKNKPLPSPPVKDAAPRTPHSPGSVRRPPLRTLSSVASFQRPNKKKVMCKGRACIIALPLDDQQGGKQKLLTSKDLERRLEKWERDGYDTRGFIVGGLNDFESDGSQSRVQFPYPQDIAEERKSSGYRVNIPNRTKWEAYVEQLKEEKLRALGVSISNGDSDLSRTTSAFSNGMSRSSSRHLVHQSISPAAAPFFLPGNQFSKHGHTYSPSLSISTGPGSRIASVTSPSQYISTSSNMHRPSQSVMFTGFDPRRVSPSGFPSHAANLRAPMTRSPPSCFNRASGVVSPLVGPGLPNVGEILSPVSPYPQQQVSIAASHLPNSEQNRQEEMRRAQVRWHNARYDNKSRQDDLRQQMQPQHLVSPALEITHPRPVSHGRNISEKLQRNVDLTERHEESAGNARRFSSDQLPQQNADLEVITNPSLENSPVFTARDNSLNKDPVDSKAEGQDEQEKEQACSRAKDHLRIESTDSQCLRSHVSKSSISKLNADAPSFDPKGAFANNPFQFGAGTGRPTLTRERLSPQNPSLSATASAFTPNSTFAVAGAAFPSDSVFSTSKFGFSSASFNINAPELDPEQSINSSAKLPLNDSNAGSSPAASRIFGDVILGAGTKAVRRGPKQAPVQRPSIRDSGKENISDESEDDEDGRPVPSLARMKRMRRHGSDGDQEPIYALMPGSPVPATAYPDNAFPKKPESLAVARSPTADDREDDIGPSSSDCNSSNVQHVISESENILNTLGIPTVESMVDDLQKSSHVSPRSENLVRDATTANKGRTREDDHIAPSTLPTEDLVDESDALLFSPINQTKNTLSSVPDPYEYISADSSLDDYNWRKSAGRSKSKSLGLADSKYAPNDLNEEIQGQDIVSVTLDTPIAEANEIEVTFDTPVKNSFDAERDSGDEEVEVTFDTPTRGSDGGDANKRDDEIEVSLEDSAGQSDDSEEDERIINTIEVELEDSSGEASLPFNVADDHERRSSSPIRGRRSSTHRLSQVTISDMPTEPEPTYEEIDAVMRQMENNPDLGVERLPTPPTRSSPVHHSTHHYPQQMLRSEAPTPSTRSHYTAHEFPQSLADESMMPPEYGLGLGIRPSVRRLDRDNGDQVSDWNSVLSSADEQKFYSRAQPLDTRVKDLVSELLNHRLTPMEQALHSIQGSLVTMTTARRNPQRQRPTSSGGVQSDADDEDDVDQLALTQSRTRSPASRKDRKADQIKIAITEAFSQYQPPVQQIENVDLFALREMIEEMRQMIVPASAQDRKAEMKSVVEEVIGSHPRLRGHRVQQSHDFGNTEDKQRLQIQGLEVMLRHADERLKDEHNLRRNVEDELADIQRRLRHSREEAAQYREASEEAEGRLHSYLQEKASIDELETEVSELRLKNNALETTLDEYRLSTTQWREDLHNEREKNRELQATMDDLRRQLQESHHARSSLKSKLEQLYTDMEDVAACLAEEQADRREKEHELVSETRLVQDQLDREVANRQKADHELAGMQRKYEELKIAERVQKQMLTEIDKVREHCNGLKAENKAHQDSFFSIQRQLRHKNEDHDRALHNLKALHKIEKEAAMAELELACDDLQAQVSRLEKQLTAEDSDRGDLQTKHDSFLDELTETHQRALYEAKEEKDNALQQQSIVHEKALNDLRERHGRALHNSSDDRHRLEYAIAEKETLSNDKITLLESKIADLEDRLEVTKSVARAAVEAAQLKQVNLPTPAASVIASPPHSAVPPLPLLRPDGLPERISPQALRETISVLQDQLGDREQAVDKLRTELDAVDRGAPNRLKEREIEVAWLREVLEVRHSDIEDIIRTLSQPAYDHEVVKAAAIRLRANLQMEQQERERAVANSSAPIAPFSPRNMVAAAAAGNWRKARDSSFTALSNYITQTPSRPTSSSPQGPLSNAMTPPSTNQGQREGVVLKPPSMRPLRPNPNRQNSQIEARPLRQISSQSRALFSRALNVSAGNRIPGPVARKQEVPSTPSRSPILKDDDEQSLVGDIDQDAVMISS